MHIVALWLLAIYQQLCFDLLKIVPKSKLVLVVVFVHFIMAFFGIHSP